MVALLKKLVAKVRDNTARAELIPLIRQQEQALQRLADAELAVRASRLAGAMGEAEFVDQPQLLVSATALAAESVRRVMGFQLHDVQLLAATVIAGGQIAEMQTGEGKTLVAAAGAFIGSLSHRGVHVATTNEYLARRDYETAKPILTLLGASVSLLDAKASVAETCAAYRSDVTYGSGYQFGFDYLRDQISLTELAGRQLGHRVTQAIHGRGSNARSLRQRGFAMAIIDEADSVMIDEAMVPLIISGPTCEDEPTEAYLLANQIIDQLSEGDDFTIDSRKSTITLTIVGKSRIHAALRDRRVPELLRPWSRYIENALQAHHHFRRDQHYVVVDDEIQIVDQNTGRIFADRTWRDGLHQAVEAKEAVPIRPSQQSTSRITRQRFYGFYDRLCGLTGTIRESAEEIRHFYGLHIVPIATNAPCLRKQLPTRFFADSDVKLQAVADSAAAFHSRRQPVLIGTTTIAQSHQISDRLNAQSIPHRMLNGVQDEDEAKIVSQAGAAGSVLVATNMAGRGTDIKPCPAALSLGGLHVIATEHALSKRIDRQLVGRAARQGNPGSCQFFVSAEDELISKYAPQLAERMISTADQNGHCDSALSEQISKLQHRIEAMHFELRKLSVQSDVWFDKVRETLH
jgi:preprotein translocase subunit SecA